MKLIDNFKENRELIKENSKIRKGKHNIEQKYNQALEDMDTIKKKYIDLLENKSEQFDLYISYQKQCDELAKEKRELKKQLAEANEMCNSLTDINDELSKDNDKLKRKIERLEKKYGKNEVVQQN